jgi:hypothetical protein
MLAPIPVPVVFPIQPAVTGAEVIQNCLDPTGAYFTTEQLAEFITTPLQDEIEVIQDGELIGVQAANLVLASPNGASGPMTARALVPADLPIVGGGLASAASITALAATNPNIGVVILTASGRAGMFSWVSGNLTTVVTNDPGQGVNVAWSGDSAPGASGAWVRQYSGRSSIAWWGAVMDGNVTQPLIPGPPTVVSAGSSTANSAALANWGTWARYQTSLGFKVYTEVPAAGPGNAYCFDHSLCQFFACGIPFLRWYNNGAYWQNIYDGAANFNYYLPWSRTALPIENYVGTTYGYPINQTTVGSFAFSIPTPANAAFMIPGQHVMLGSLDIQYNGFPPNLQFFEFPKVWTSTQYSSASISSGTYTVGTTGVLSLTFATAPFGASVGATLNGAFVTISGLTGTGDFAALNGTWAITSTGSSGTVINLAITNASGITSSSVSGGTLAAVGMVTLDRPIEYQHLTTYPDDGGGPPAGAARVWLMDTPGNVINGVAQSYVPWGIDHVWYDLNIGIQLNAAGSSYWTISGYSVVTENYLGPGFSESVFQSILHKNPKLIYVGEPDKLGKSLKYDNLEFVGQNGNASTNRLLIQSPFDQFVLTDSRVNLNLSLSGVKNAEVDNCVLGDANINGVGLGLSNKILFRNSSMQNVSGVGGTGIFSIYDGSTTFQINGTSVTYANGTITVVKSDFSSVQAYNAVPGMTGNFPATATGYTNGLFSDYLGNFEVVNVREDSTNYYIDTTGPASLPTWASGYVTLFHANTIKFENCRGCNNARQASAASDADGVNGSRPDYWEYKEFPFSGAAGNYLHDYQQFFYGTLVKVVVEVENPGTATNAQIVIDFATYQTNNLTGGNFTRDSPDLQITIVVGVVAGAGPDAVRTITQGSFVNNQTGDAITCNGSTITSTGLPTKRVVGQTMTITPSNFSTSNDAAPRFIVKMWFDCGRVRKAYSTVFDNYQGAQNVALISDSGC